MKMKIVYALLIVLSSLSFACNMSASIYLPAVQKTSYGYKGVIANANVQVRPGSGHVFVDTFPLTEIDTQASARLARDVAFKLLGMDPNKYDVFYTIRSDSPIIGGPSAGGALTVATISALKCLNVSKDVIMTGTINPDGSIGPVGGIFEKAGAAASHGAKLFLLPKGQSVVTVERTEKEKIPFGIQIITKPMTIDMKKYAKNNWNMTVLEVSNVNQALKYMTGYEIEEKKSKRIDDTKVKYVMKSVAKNMLSIAKEKLDETKSEISSSKLSLDYISQLKSMYQDAENEYKNATKFYNSGDYYTSASMSFGVWIKCSYINNIVKYSDKEALRKKINSVDDEIREVYSMINKTKNEINSPEDVEVITLSEERISDAENYVDKAWKDFYNDNYISACYNIAYAEERARTARIWLNLTNYFNEKNMTFNFSSLKSIAEKRIDDAKASILYAKTIMGSVGNADELLDRAENEYDDGRYASALMNAIMAKATADAFMETNGLQDKSKVSEFKIEAENSIADAESKGYVPLVAINYYDYANNLNDVQSKLLYYKYADELAQIDEDLTGQHVQKEVVIRKVSEAQRSTSLLPIYVMASLFIGFVAGRLTNKNVKKK